MNIYLIWFYCFYLQNFSSDNELTLQMIREINQISRWLPSFECKIDDQGVKIFYYDLWIDLKLLKWWILSNSPKTNLVWKILNIVRRLPFFGQKTRQRVKIWYILNQFKNRSKQTSKYFPKFCIQRTFRLLDYFLDLLKKKHSLESNFFCC
jgi:hypothetical protein